MNISIPEWCKIGLFVEWYAPKLTGVDEWVKEEIIGYTYSGFLHRAHNCPMYETKFSEWGKTVREYTKKKKGGY